jgi:uncharacterized protein (DUF58 family)
LKPARTAAEALLPCPGVHFGTGFARRLERLVLHLRSVRERREGAGSAALAGSGDEFIGYRPYRPGEDLRDVDWNLLARLDRPYVRVTRREASEHWAILLDASASMGVGPPGKLQVAAETACALAAVALRQGARVLLRRSSADGAANEIVVRAKHDLPRLIAFLENSRATGESGLTRLVSDSRATAGAGRLFVLGDFTDLEPRDLAHLQRRGRELLALQVLAPVELDPPQSGSIEWVDPESGERVEIELDARSLSAYRRSLEQRLENWQSFAAHHGMRYACVSTATPFEDVLPGLLGV